MICYPDPQPACLPWPIPAQLSVLLLLRTGPRASGIRGQAAPEPGREPAGLSSTGVQRWCRRASRGIRYYLTTWAPHLFSLLLPLPQTSLPQKAICSLLLLHLVAPQNIPFSVKLPLTVLF